MLFVVVGWVLSSYVSAVMWGMGFSLKTEMDQGILESNWVAPVSPAVLLVGRTLASIAVTSLTTERDLGALDLLPAAFPIEEILSERDLRHVKLLYGIGGLSYGNVISGAGSRSAMVRMSSGLRPQTNSMSAPASA